MGEREPAPDSESEGCGGDRSPQAEPGVKPTRRWPKAIECVSDEVAAILRSKTPAERVAMASEMHATAKLIIRASVRHRHPEWGEEQIRQAILERLTYGTA